MKIKHPRFIFVFAALIVTLVAPVYLFAQEFKQWGDDDGRLNMEYWMDGMGLYCTNAARTPATTYENGGGFLILAPEDGSTTSTEVLWVPEEDIIAGIKQVEETGEYATLGQAEAGTWFDPQPAIYYLPSGEFQVNIAKSSVDDLREGKLYTFYWTSCRDGLPIVTDDGCAPGKDPDEFGTCT